MTGTLRRRATASPALIIERTISEEPTKNVKTVAACKYFESLSQSGTEDISSPGLTLHSVTVKRACDVRREQIANGPKDRCGDGDSNANGIRGMSPHQSPVFVFVLV